MGQSPRTSLRKPEYALAIKGMLVAVLVWVFHKPNQAGPPRRFHTSDRPDQAGSPRSFLTPEISESVIPSLEGTDQVKENLLIKHFVVVGLLIILAFSILVLRGLSSMPFHDSLVSSWRLLQESKNLTVFKFASFALLFWVVSGNDSFRCAMKFIFPKYMLLAFFALVCTCDRNVRDELYCGLLWGLKVYLDEDFCAPKNKTLEHDNSKATFEGGITE
jgi:hypothetical protein